MIKLFWIALGGSLGALLRHGLTSLAHRLLPPTFPWGTLAANLVGCFLIGALWVCATEYSFSQTVRGFVFTGSIGSLTMFSTYGLESLMLLREGGSWREWAISSSAMFSAMFWASSSLRWVLCVPFACLVSRSLPPWGSPRGPGDFSRTSTRPAWSVLDAFRSASLI